MSKHVFNGTNSGNQVTVWTPWGAQSVPHADSKLASVRRLVRKAKEQAASHRTDKRKRLLDA